MSPRLHAYLLLLIVSLIWGVAGPIIKFTLRYFPPDIFLTYRFAISSLVALMLSRSIKRYFPTDPKDRLLVFLYGFLTTTVGLGLLFLGFTFTSSLAGTVIAAAAPIFITSAGVLILKEHVTKKEMLGIGIAFAGTTIIILEPIVNNSSGLFSYVKGNLFIALYLLVFVATSVMAKEILRRCMTPSGLTHLSFLIGFITIFPLSLLTHSPTLILTTLISVPLVGHLGVFYMALLSGTVAYSLYHRAQKTIEIGETALFGYLNPLWAAPFSLLWLKESVSSVFILGSIITAIGVTVAEIKKKQRSSLIKNKLIH